MPGLLREHLEIPRRTGVGGEHHGPGGIGACLSLREFEDNHQQPWLDAFPDRKVQNLDIRDKLEHELRGALGLPTAEDAGEEVLAEAAAEA